MERVAVISDRDDSNAFSMHFRRKHRGQFNDTRFLTCLSYNGTRFGSVFSAIERRDVICRCVYVNDFDVNYDDFDSHNKIEGENCAQLE